jgi:menaquinone-dependent protoporphyrinogen oxidase
LIAVNVNLCCQMLGCDSRHLEGGSINMAILVLYATVEGQSRKIAEHVSADLESRGHMVVLGDLREPGFAVPGRFDGIILCAPIHIGRYPDPVIHFASTGKRRWIPSPTHLFPFRSPSPATARTSGSRPGPTRLDLRERQATGLSLLHHAAGALKYLEYDFFKRMMLRHISAKEGGPVDTSRDHELTDWETLDRFVGDFSDLVVRTEDAEPSAI